MDVEQTAKLIVEDIERDLTNRRGLRQEWAQIADEIKDEIRQKWARLVAARLRL